MTWENPIGRPNLSEVENDLNVMLKDWSSGIQGFISSLSWGDIGLGVLATTLAVCALKE